MKTQVIVLIIVIVKLPHSLCEQNSFKTIVGILYLKCTLQQYKNLTVFQVFGITVAIL